MNIIPQLLTPNPFSRPGRKLSSVKAIILHWVENPQTSAKFNWKYFENRKNGKTGYGSAHFIIGLEGEVIQAVPESEIAYHVGSSKLDPVSNQFYTDWAREKFGTFASTTSSPNHCTLGIELCHTDWEGNFTKETYDSAVHLTAYLLDKNKLYINDIGTHHGVVGWKDCPKLWVDKPELFEQFKLDVKHTIGE